MDLTSYQTIPTITATGTVRSLSGAECAAKADECRQELALLLTASTRRQVRRELRGWERLAQERGA